MLYSILRSEWYKLRKSKISFIILAAPLVGLFAGLSSGLADGMEKINGWYASLMAMTLTYALLFLPLVTGVLAGFICRYEHQEGGWKQLLSLPVTRSRVYIAKFLLILCLVFFIQWLFLGSLYLVGTIKGITDPFPMTIVWKSILGGWVASFPLVALQLWMSMIWKNFAASFTVNVIFTLPAILAVNSKTFGPVYPWGQPFLMMYAGGGTDAVFFVPWEQVLTTVGGSFLLFFVGGLIYFQKKPV
ncbi:ABC transporter permease subunit [Virgibacillus sp. MSP4-1]|uniref:ABC transporter permease n=1 Tax=Virgibacillus sp. MSP4-1 TaxID=2700081 RepID=UPI00039B86ED|nr:ABC transporter permease [Virgibacillus sp. MSP4-1]QHS22805.1 ABC transporter permease subunit [Virgibacillus sp. MSP4-1]